MVLLGHEADKSDSSGELGDVVFLPRGIQNLQELEPRTRMGIFSWMSMLWLSFTNKALHGATEQETRLVLRTFSAFKAKSESSRIHPLEFARSLDLDVTRNYLMMLYSRIGKLLGSASGISGTSLDAEVTHLLLLICAGLASPDGKVSMPSLWSQVRREAERLARQAVSSVDDSEGAASDMARRISTIIDEVIQFVTNDARKGSLGEWQKSKEWEGLMDLWIGLFRTVSRTTNMRRISR